MQISPLVNFTSLPRLLRKCNWEDIYAILLDKRLVVCVQPMPTAEKLIELVSFV